MKHKLMIFEAIFIAAALLLVYYLYPNTIASVSGDAVRFESGNAKTVVLADNPDFLNSRIIEINKNTTIHLGPGKYYWKAGNDFIQGLVRELVVGSEVGLEINNDSELENIGNVRLNVTRSENGTMVGHIILEPEQAEKIENGEYTGRQDGK